MTPPPAAPILDPSDPRVAVARLYDDAWAAMREAAGRGRARASTTGDDGGGSGMSRSAYTVPGVTERVYQERFWSKTQKTEGCWLWTDAPDSGGYGRLMVRGQLVKAHRFAYELLVGPIPDGLVIDHVK